MREQLQREKTCTEKFNKLATASKSNTKNEFNEHVYPNLAQLTKTNTRIQPKCQQTTATTTETTMFDTYFAIAILAMLFIAGRLS